MPLTAQAHEDSINAEPDFCKGSSGRHAARTAHATGASLSLTRLLGRLRQRGRHVVAGREQAADLAAEGDYAGAREGGDVNNGLQGGPGALEGRDGTLPPSCVLAAEPGWLLLHPAVGTTNPDRLQGEHYTQESPRTPEPHHTTGTTHAWTHTR